MKIENASSVYFDMRAVLYFYNGKDEKMFIRYRICVSAQLR